MTVRVTFEQFSPGSAGPTLTLGVAAGQSLAVVGPAASGKSRLLRVVAGEERAGQGSVQVHGSARLVQAGALPKRSRVQALFRTGPELGAEEITDLLVAGGLWDERHSTVGDLTPAQVASLELVEALASPEKVVLVDGQLDHVDPWTYSRISEWMRRRTDRTFVVATHRPDHLRDFDVIVVLKGGQIRFAGSPGELVRQGPRTEMVLATRNQPGVKALVEPFEVSVRQNAGLVHLEAPEGQDLAARLLLEGYGDVKFIVVREPTMAEALEWLA